MVVRFSYHMAGVWNLSFNIAIITFDISDERFAQLRRELEQVFKGFDYYHDCS